MNSNPTHRRAWAALLLAGALVAGTAGAVPTLGAGEEPESTAAAGSATSAAPDAGNAEQAEASPAPTPLATFDPGAVSIRLDLFVDGLSDPVALVDDGTGRDCVYLVERAGVVYIVDAPSGLVNPRPFIDISGLVGVGPEQGLLGLAFHPGFAKNGRFFAHYNGAKTGASVVAEFMGRPCKSGAKPVKPLRLSVEQPYPNNNGGWVGFGPDGYLYVALGDGGGVSPGDPNGIGQSKSARLSKILRLDVDRGRGAVAPKSNPYAKKRQGFDPLTWAYGLRDPRHASFDRETGDLWIADLGQDRYEEVNRIPAGSLPKGGPVPNFGWSDMEGDRCHNLPDCDPAAYTLPVYLYDKAPPHDGITGGYVYRGEAMPELQGVYVFSDRLSGYIWGLDAAAAAAGQPIEAHRLLDFPQGIVSFGEDDGGELYAIAADGSVFKVEPEEA